MAITYARTGQQNEAQKILDRLLQERRKRYVSAQIIAAIYVGLGDNEEAFRWLELAATEHSGILQSIAFLPDFVRFVPTNISRTSCGDDVPHNSSVSITETSLSEIKDQNAQTHLSLRIHKAATEYSKWSRRQISSLLYDLTERW